MWAVKLIFSPVGKVLLAVLAFVTWTAYQRADATADCRDEQLRQELEQANRMLVEAQRLASEASLRAARTAQELKLLEADRDSILSDMEARGASCPIPDDLRERLRAIR